MISRLVSSYDWPVLPKSGSVPGLPSHDKSVLVPRPAAGHTALRWLRAAVTLLRSRTLEVAEKLGGSHIAETRKLDEIITMFLQKTTLGSFRVTAPDMAYQKGISKERRRYLGHWASDGAVDTYTRTHRSHTLEFGRGCFVIPSRFP